MGYSNVAGDLNVYSDTSTSTLTVRNGAFFDGGLVATSCVVTFGNVVAANLTVTGNFTVTATNTQISNSLSINNFGTATAIKVVQYEGGGPGHIHNVAEFWDYHNLAMVIDPEGNVGIHTGISPGYAFTVLDGALIDSLTLTNPLAVSAGGIGVTTTTQNYVFAGPQFGSGAPDFRYLVNSDLPSVISVSNVSGNGSGLSSLIGSNVTGNVENATVALVVSQAAQPNITSVGLLSNLAVSNSVTTTNLAANTMTLANATASITGNLYVSNSVSTTNLYTINVVDQSGNFGTVNQVLTKAASGTLWAAPPSILSVGLTGSAVYPNIENILFDTDSGFDVTSGPVNTVTIAMNSTFKYWDINGTLAITAEGLDTVNFISGPAITITGGIDGGGNKYMRFDSNSTGTGAFANLIVSNAVTTTNLVANTMTLANATASITGNLYVSNALSTTNAYLTGALNVQGVSNLWNANVANVYALRYFGDGGLLSNITGVVTGNVLSNLNASNLAFGTINSALILGNTLSNIQFANVSGVVTGNVLSNLNASNLAFGTINSALILGNTLSNIQFSNVTGLVTGNALSNLNASNLAFGVVNSALILGNTLSNIQFSNVTGLVTGNVLSNLNASNLAFGTINSALILGNTLSNIQFSNVSGLVTGNALSNLNASNLAFGIVNSALILGNTLSNIQFSNVSGLVTANTLSNINASNLAFGTINSALILGNVLSNISSSNITGNVANATVALVVSQASQPNITSVGILSNLTVSNAVTTTNLFANTLTLANTSSRINVIGSVTATTFYGALAGANTGAFSNIYSANALTTTNIFANTITLANASASITGNLYVSNAVVTTNLYTAGITSNASNTVFNYDTLTVPYMYATTMNVTTTANIANIFTTNIVGFIGSQWTTGTGNVYYLGNVGIGTSLVSANLTVLGNIYASNSLQTTNAYLTGVLNVQGVSNLWNANVANVYALRYFGDGGLLSNITSFANLVVSNTVTTTNIVANTLTLANTSSRINVIGSVTASTFYGAIAGSNTGAFSNIYSANALTTTNLFANTMSLANASASITGNLYVSNAITTTNLVTAGITSNASNTVFNYDTLTVPYMYATTMNVTTTANIANVFATTINASTINVASISVPGSTPTPGYVLSTTGTGLSWIAAGGGGSSQWTTGTGNIYYTGGSVGIGTSAVSANLSVAGNIYASNALTTANAFLTNLTATNDLVNLGQYLIPSTANSAIITQWLGRYSSSVNGTAWNKPSISKWIWFNNSNIVNYTHASLLMDGRVLFNIGSAAGFGPAFFYPSTNQFSYMSGGQFSGVNTYQTAMTVRVPDGNVFTVNSVNTVNGIYWGLYNPDSQSWYTTTAPSLSGFSGFDPPVWGMCTGPDSNVYCAPYNWSNIGVFNYSTTSFSWFPIAEKNGGVLFSSATLTTDGRIVFTPGGTSNVGIFTPSTWTYSNIGCQLSASGGAAGYGPSTILPNGNIFMASGYLNGSNSTYGATIFNPNTKTVQNITAIPGGKWYIGISPPTPDGRIFLFPRENVGGTTVDVYNWITNSYAAVVGGPSGSTQGGTKGLVPLLPDGRIIVPPNNPALSMGIIETGIRVPPEYCYSIFFAKN